MSTPAPMTRFPEGSLRELWAISSPLMISTLAMLFMIFTDRIFLAHYSIEALNASVNAGTLAWAFISGIGMVTAMSEVFVAQYNGAKLFKRIGTTVWQMIWFSGISLLLFIPLAIWGVPLFFNGSPHAEMEIVYFRYLMVFAPGYALLTAFAGFFIGRGKTKLMIWLAVIANGINILLDRVLIFGIEGWVPEMGIKGAAIATCCGYLLESAVLLYLFLRKENRETFGTRNWRFNGQEMAKCLTVGAPQGLFCTIEVIGWAVFYWMMTHLSEKHITVSSICQSFAILLSFFFDGLSRGAAALAGNFIGSKRHELVKSVLKSGLILLFLFLLTISAFLFIDPASFLFIAEVEGGGAGNAIDPAFASSLKICMVLCFAYVFFDGLRWLLGGLLTAAGDTRFILLFGSFSVWAFLLIPVHFIVVKNGLPVEYAWGLKAAFVVLLSLVYLLRFRNGAWKKIDLVGQAPKESVIGGASVSSASPKN
jgi:MATE family, multidrug efflux pump